MYLNDYPYTVLNNLALQDMLDLEFIVGGSYSNINGHYIDLCIEKDIVLKPREKILVYTEEYFNIPQYLTGWITMRSTYARKFLDQINSIPLKAGWKGNLLLELVNHGDELIQIDKGCAVVQAWFMKTPIADAYSGKFNNQSRTK